MLSSRPGWGLEENIEKWDGVYLDTDDRVVALDVDGDPENRQAVLIGESMAMWLDGMGWDEIPLYEIYIYRCRCNSCIVSYAETVRVLRFVASLL